VALLTGHNHHANNAGAIMELATACPGNTGVRPQSITPMAEILRQNGYSTATFGKYHETPPWEVSVSGPYDRWPTKSGFDKFYGFIGGETNQWAPTVLEAAKLPQPKSVNGVTQRPMNGVSMAYAFDDARAADRRTTQHFEIFGNRAVYHEGWVAATWHSIPWLLAENPPLADDVWELDNLDEAKPRTGGKSILSVDEKKIAEGHIPRTQPFAFSGDEGADVGVDGETNVSNDYEPGANAFTGKIIRVTVERK
jgi:arylsulfatase A-like enzyme